MAPFFLLFFAFGLFPLVYTAWVSLHSVTLQNTEDMTWVGLDNYSRLLHDPLFWNALGNTFTIGVLSTVPQLLMALGLAHVLNYRLRGRTFFRVAMLMADVVQGIEEYFAGRGCSLLIEFTADVAGEIEIWRRWVANSYVDGIVMTTPAPSA